MNLTNPSSNEKTMKNLTNDEFSLLEDLEIRDAVMNEKNDHGVVLNESSDLTMKERLSLQENHDKVLQEKQRLQDNHGVVIGEVAVVSV